MSKCPVCDTELYVQYIRDDTMLIGVTEVCNGCDYIYTHMDTGTDVMTIQGQTYSWHHYTEVGFYRASQAVEHARAALHYV